MESDDEDEAISSLLGNGKPPRDRFNLVYWIMYVQGIGTLLPWNMFITAHTYFDYKLKNETGTNASGQFQYSFENYFSVGFMIPNLSFLALNVFLKHHFSLRQRFTTSILIVLSGFVVTVALVPLDSFSWQNGFFGVTMVIVLFTAVGGAVYQSGVFGLAGMFQDHKYTSAVMAGQGLAGIFASLASIFSILGGSGPEESGIAYFSCGIFVLLAAIATFFLLHYIKFSQFFLHRQKGKSVVQRADDEEEEDRKVIRPNFWFIFKRIWKPALNVFIIFFVTLSIFPAITSNIKSVAAHPDASPWTDAYFTPVTCFLLFNACDFTGRTIAAWIPFISSKWLWLPSFLRLAFLPLYVFCNVQPRDSPVVFNSDVFPIVFMLLMAISNGYLSTLAMMYGPSFVSDHEKETAGTMMALFLGLGLVAGSGFSFALAAMIKHIG
ncbi:equilibrative nucleoside transporter 3-like isoform X2 [Oscarella lobularis]|uniref:equilibrative nucleoside transporter 3-like isoform X2 n=1 Tax=Oscarella lobularis TaxID=121494 RepID=UPI0033140419